MRLQRIKRWLRRERGGIRHEIHEAIWELVKHKRRRERLRHS
jgi:hypothetical protein